MKYESVIYISHPYGGDHDNKKMIGNFILELQKIYPNFLFISPVHSFSFAYHYVPYQQGLDMCLWLLEKCDEMWVFGEYQSSIGCMSEIAYCKNHNIYYQIIGENCFAQNKMSRKCSDCGLLDERYNSFKCLKSDTQRIYEKIKNLEECN